MTGEQYVRAVRDHWRIVAVAVIAGILLAVLAIAVVPKKYSASVDTFVLPAGFTPDTSSAYEGGLLSAQRVKSYVELFSGGRISDVVVDRLGLPMTSSELNSEISVSTQTDSVILTIGVEDPSPQRAQLIADTAAKVFQELVGQLEQPKDARLAPATSVKIVAPAKLADTPAFPHRSLFLAAGAVIGLLAGLGLALWRNTRGRALRSTEELRDLLGVPALGTVLHAKPEAGSLLPGKFSPELESLRQIRTSLQFADVDHQRKIVVITSAVSGEGKTQTAGQLAAVLAAAGHRVLLLDADLRRSGAGELTGLDHTVGVTTVITGRCSMEDAVQRHPTGFDFLAAGTRPHNPSELCASEAMARLLDRAGERYEYVLVDSAPLLPVSDSATIAGRADGVVLVCRFGSTLDVEVREAGRMLERVQATLWGTVLTMVPKRVTGSRRYGYYGGQPAPIIDEAIRPENSSATPSPRPVPEGLDHPTLTHQPFVTNGERRPRPRPTHALPPVP